VKGGKVYGRWPGLDPSQLYEGRDLALTTDFRQVVGEAVARHMGNKNLNAVFPGYENQPSKFLRLLDSAAAGRRQPAVGFCRDHLQRRESSSPCQPKCDQQKHYVITIFGQAFSPHWPRQTSCSDEENGARYGIGH